MSRASVRCALGEYVNVSVVSVKRELVHDPVDARDLAGRGRVRGAVRIAGKMSAFAPWLYYWDDRDGPNWQGWWLAPEVGCDTFMAFANSDSRSPEEAIGWRTGEALVDMQIMQLEDGLLGVKAPSLASLEGVYELEAAHPHSHGGRPVFKRARDLTPEEVLRLDNERAAAEVVTYTQEMRLDGSAAGSNSGIIVQEPVMGVAANPLGVVGVPTVASVLDWVNGGDGVVVRGMPLVDTLACTTQEEVHQPLQTVRIVSAVDLDQQITKGADEILSIPELHDEESPLPVGWVVAGRSNAPVTCTARQHLMQAVTSIENELPGEVATLQPVQQQANSLRRLVDLADGPFTVCVWSHKDTV
jgi:hypothetical protein